MSNLNRYIAAKSINLKHKKFNYMNKHLKHKELSYMNKLTYIFRRAFRWLCKLTKHTKENSCIGWAREEVRRACLKENPSWNGKDFDYGCSCYKSALAAYEMLCKEGHSGFSFGITKSILTRLMDMRPLTPIEDNDDEWNLVSDELFPESKKGHLYQSRRCPSLFKTVKYDGSVKYTDNDRVYMKNVVTGNTYCGGGAAMLIDELFPITMPYMPKTKSYVIMSDEFDTQTADAGSFDTKVYYYVITPNGERVEVNRFYKEEEYYINDSSDESDKRHRFVAIDEAEFNERKATYERKRAEVLAEYERKQAEQADGASEVGNNVPSEANECEG